MKIGVIGLGKLGIPMLSAFAMKGFDVLGYDKNPTTIDKLKNRILPITEPGIKEVMDIDALWPQRFTSDIKELHAHADMIFVIVPTPTINDSLFDSTVVSSIVSELKILNDSSNKQLDLVITSTINPGDCECLLELLQGSKINLIYSPEFIALGTVLHDILHPDICIIGNDSPFAADRVEWVYSKLYNSTPVYHKLSHVEAEIVKISINSYVTVKISFANTIGALVHTHTHGDMQKVKRTLEAIGGDSRINTKYFKFGNGFSGPCFPRDNKCLSYHLRKKGLSNHLPFASDNVNTFILDYWTKTLQRQQNNYKNICYVGLCYKPNTDYMGESFVVDLHHKVKSLDKNYYFIDPNIGSFPAIEKISDISLDKDSTLFVINYGDTELVKNLRKHYNILELWA